MGKKVIVLGGGIGGLTAAHELLERGFDVKVYELRDIPGGKSRSIPVPNSGTGGRADLPGEHGFRFVPAFYKHLPDSMKRIPYGNNKDGCYDNLTGTSRIEIASYGMEPIVLPSRMPRSLADFILILKDVFDPPNIGLEEGELEFFAERLWQVMTSCDQRRLHELENESWWDFTDAENKSEAYQKYLAEGLSRSLVAARAREGSARTIGQVQVHLMFGILNAEAGSTDRVLNGPTSDQLLNPWIAQVRALGGVYTRQVRCTSIEMADREISSVSLHNEVTGEDFTDTADFYVSALPVEVIGPLVTDDMVAADPDLDNLRTLQDHTAWMNGIQFFLKEDVTITHGHVLYVDSPWAITSISEAQFWSSLDLSNFGAGDVGGILSVDISDWEAPGTFNKKMAKDCTEAEIAEEVWKQLCASINIDEEILKWDNVVCSFLDTDIVIPNIRKAKSTINLEPLFINKPDTWDLRPPADTGIANFFLASDYVQTNSDLACMEAANEAARRSVNAILVRTGSSETPCTLFDMGMPDAMLPWRIADQQRWAQGKPWSGHILADADQESVSFAKVFASMKRRAKNAVGRGAVAPNRAPIDANAITLKDDAYHLSEYLGSDHLFWYTEWWYFNFLDKANNRGGMVTFAVFNGADVDLLGIASLNAVVFDPDNTGITTKMDYHGLNKFYASEERPDVTLAGSRMKAIDDNTFEVNATTADGSISMELIFEQADEPQLLADGVHAEESWEVSSWLAYMPSAKVSGWLTINGTKYDLEDATGYHDHDWGEWFIPGNTWGWAAFSEPGQMSFDVGLHAAFQKSTAYFRLGDERLFFPQDTYKYTFSNWKRWKIFYKYPETVTFTATDSTGNYKLDLVWNVDDTSILWKYPLIVFEQTAQFTGQLLKKTESGSWEVVQDIDTQGYSEYTLQWDGQGPT